ncbi:sodium-dependent bicarbonate transport family permease [Polaribacter sp.]|uniref:sodium-dependent bicarbonate transport family permease n=1 Tax=Polaribacter sp. TaxID=1920175 RepID=UPI003F6A50BB
MDLHYLIDNLTNPALLFFFLGLVAVNIKSDLRIPENSSKFISLYLLLAIGFKGGQELANSVITSEIINALLFGILLAVVVPIYSYFILRIKLSVENSGAIASAYGSVSAVTFVTTISFLEMSNITFGGHMVAVMAVMEAPSIIIGVLLIAICTKDQQNKTSFKTIIRHSLTNGSVVLIIGSLLVGYFTNDAQAEGIKPFTTDIFKGFLAVFLLDMGIVSGQKLKALLKKGWFTVSFAIIIPIINGCIVAVLSGFFMDEIGNRLLMSILAASASYIAVPAAMKLAVPKANPGLYIPMALAITFPFNITIGMPLYLNTITYF